MKAPRVREAKPAERGIFMSLCRAFLEENVTLGGWMQADDTNVEQLAKFFDAYTTGTMEGTVKFIGHEAVIMAGAIGSPFKMSFGKGAQGWFTYVKPEVRKKGYSKLLREAVISDLTDMGFDMYFGSTSELNEAAVASVPKGFERGQFIVMKRLTKE